MKTLKLIIALFVCAIVLPGFSQINKVAAQKNIGLQLYSLRDTIGRNSENLDEVLSEISKMGYKYVETANYSNGKIYGLTPEEFKAKLAAKGMFALSTHAGRELAKVISETKWDEVWAWWDQCIADHKAAGFKYIITASMPQPEAVEDLKLYCDYYNQVGEKCAAAGLKFGYHNHAIEFTKKYPDKSKVQDNAAITTPDGRQIQRRPPEICMYEFMLTNTDPSKVFFEMDVYWTVMGQRSPVELFKKYPGRFTVLHIKDEKELGESGMVGFDAIFKYIAISGAKYLIVEVERYDLPYYESVKASIDYLNKADFVKTDYSK
jgi:sugar phosphate isomerase/epimerase